MGDSQDAKNIVHDTFTTLFHKKEEIGTVKNFAGYLYTLLKNKTLNFLEKKNVRRTYLDSLPFDETYTVTGRIIDFNMRGAKLDATLQDIYKF